VTSLAGVVTVSGRFRDHAERLVVEAIARTVPGVVSVEVSGEVSRARDLRVG
jgi:osmotically-inducible protein OsmY